MSKESARDFIARLARVKQLSNQDQEPRIRANKLASEPIVRELREAGFDVEWVADLRHFVGDYAAAIPILIRWLPIVDNAALKADIVRTLSIPSQKAVIPLLIQEYRKASNDSLEQRNVRDAIANALEILAEDAIFEQIAELVQDTGMGPSRAFLALALGKMRDPRAIDILLSLVDDPEVCPFAIAALGKLRASAARNKIREYLRSPVPEVAAAAKSALARIDRRRH